MHVQVCVQKVNKDVQTWNICDKIFYHFCYISPFYWNTLIWTIIYASFLFWFDLLFEKEFLEAILSMNFEGLLWQLQFRKDVSKLEKYRNESNAQEKQKLLLGLTSVSEPWILSHFLFLAEDSRYVFSVTSSIYILQNCIFSTVYLQHCAQSRLLYFTHLHGLESSGTIYCLGLCSRKLAQTRWSIYTQWSIHGENDFRHHEEIQLFNEAWRNESIFC